LSCSLFSRIGRHVRSGFPTSGNEIDAAGNVIASGGVRLEGPRTRTKFPFHTSSAKKLNVTNPPIITVVGKAFFDIGHSLKDQSQNRRRNLPGYAARGIHPVMKIETL